MSKKRHAYLIVPIFLPNQGCPERCVFCEQEPITSQPNRPLSPDIVTRTLKEAIRSQSTFPTGHREIAFYGGTFTRLPIGLMKGVLEAAAAFLQQGFFDSIRASTRPDSLDEGRLALMKSYGVQTVELGAQSLDDSVLSKSRRGHSVEDILRAFRLLKTRGFRVGIQLMPGLPGDCEKIFLRSIRTVIRLRPDMVRLYPTLVLRGTVLARWYHNGKYVPMDLDEAVKLCARACESLEENQIPVIRVGLMNSPGLRREGQILGGPWHPSFGFLVRARLHQKKIDSYLPRKGEAKRIRLFAPGRELPLVRGYRNRGLQAIKERTGAEIIGVIADESVSGGTVKVERL